ncbi:MAG: hypothetical protein K2X43_14620 [Hyphomonadaceae bacterium]|nr:hypothetical protein [Hyphomonadaceae bacterium]
MIFDPASRLLPDTAVMAAISGLMANASFEMTPFEVGHKSSMPIRPAPNTEIYLTSLRGVAMDVLVQAAADLRAVGARPVVHIAARRLGSREDLRLLAGRLADVGCDGALVIAGDEPNLRGSFASSIEVLETGELERAGFKTISVAGHPEGSPAIGGEALWDALRRKNDYAQSSTATFRLVTQFCFSGNSVLTWEKEARRRGNRLPVHVGVPGPTTITKLIKFAAMCGVTVSAGFLRRQSWSALQLARRWRPDEFVASLAAGKQSDPASLIERLHFFPFGALPEVFEYIELMRAQALAASSR